MNLGVPPTTTRSRVQASYPARAIRLSYPTAHIPAVVVSAVFDIKARQGFHLALNIIPIGLWIDKEAPLFGVDGDNHLAITVIQELIPESRGNSDATFRINIHVVYAPEHAFRPTP
jgi:hypothetical protein